ncbi:MAG: pyridoxal-phosphate-dependent aminotransferase family protein [Microvirga sp.]
MSHQPGRHFLQIPGPTNTPLPVLAAIAKPTIDHRGPEFGILGREVLAGIKTVFKTRNPVVIYPASGTGAWEAALVNTLSAGDRVLMFETGWFATLWNKMATRLGLRPEFIKGDWRTGVNADAIEARLSEDKAREIKAVAVVHNETSTGVASGIAAVRRAIDKAGHPALLLVDTISSLGSIDYRHDVWGVDVTVGGSQKGLMLPPGLSFNAVSDKALAASKKAQLPRSFWAWDEMIAANEKGYFPYTPATNLLQGLKVALGMLHEEGLDNVFARHDLLARATRAGAQAIGLEIYGDADERSTVVTAVELPDSIDGGKVPGALRKLGITANGGQDELKGRIIRIAHCGYFGAFDILTSLSGLEIVLDQLGHEVEHGAGAGAAQRVFLEAGVPAAA